MGHCERCGARIGHGAAFCPGCGVKLIREQVDADRLAAVQPQPQPSAAVSGRSDRSAKQRSRWLLCGAIGVAALAAAGGLVLISLEHDAKKVVVEQVPHSATSGTVGSGVAGSDAAGAETVQAAHEQSSRPAPATLAAAARVAHRWFSDQAQGDWSAAAGLETQSERSVNDSSRYSIVTAKPQYYKVQLGSATGSAGHIAFVPVKFFSEDTIDDTCRFMSGHVALSYSHTWKLNVDVGQAYGGEYYSVAESDC
jgi:hypothetical protein